MQAVNDGPLIRLSNISKSFGQVAVLKNLSLDLNAGERVALLGRSGSGKSTLLYLLGGLDQVDEGEINIGGEQLHRYSDDDLATFRREHVGFIFQHHFLLPSISGLENILVPAQISNMDLGIVENEVRELSQQLGVEHCLAKYPHQMSGGEQQRINLIRAVITHPKLILCDEPTGNLDRSNSDRVVRLLEELTERYQATMILVTHDQQVASSFPRRITIDDGRIVG